MSKEALSYKELGMGKNKAQFQKGYSLVDLYKKGIRIIVWKTPEKPR
jgi:hypothetical protein